MVRMKTVVALALLLPLCGCKSFLGTHIFARNTPRAMPSVNVDRIIAPATSQGRMELDAGRPGAAIEKFRAALGADEPIAPALNGLAVAYARVGRLDLAQRYFEQAAAAAPEDLRYQANLAAVIQERMLAAQIASKRMAEVEAAEARKRTALLQDRPGQLQRISRGEVRIADALPQPAPLAKPQTKVAMARNIVEGEPDLKGFRAVVRLKLPATAPKAAAGHDSALLRGFTPGVRIVLASTEPPRSRVSTPRRER